MNLPYFVDEKNRKSIPQFEAVANEDLLKSLEQGVSVPPTSADKKLLAAIAVLRALPVVNVADLANRWKTRNVVKSQTQVYAAVVPDTYATVLRADALSLTASTVKSTLKNTGLPAAIALVSKYRSDFNPNTGKKIQKMQKSIEKGLWKLEEYSAIDTFAQAPSYALFTRYSNGKEGFMGKNGDLGPLSKAQTYDSEEDMHSFIRRHSIFRYIEKMQVVKLNMSVIGLGDTVTSPHYKGGNTWNGQVDLNAATIYEVGALLQRQAIEDALSQASREQLEQAYKKLEENSALESTESTVKRKM